MTGEMSFKCLGFLTVYLEPKQWYSIFRTQTMVQCFSKNSNQILAVTIFAEKLYHKMFDWDSITPLFPVKNKEINYLM